MTNGHRFAEEQQQFLRSLPKQTFEARRLGQANADSLSLVRFDTNSYSVPTKYAYRQITIVATVDEVRLIFEDRLIARHQRHWGREQHFFGPVHYLALLERKPGGFDHARPLENWNPPVCFGILRRRLEAELDGMGTREFPTRTPQVRRTNAPPRKHTVKKDQPHRVVGVLDAVAHSMKTVPKYGVTCEITGLIERLWKSERDQLKLNRLTPHRITQIDARLKLFFKQAMAESSTDPPDCCGVGVGFAYITDIPR